MNAYPDSEPFPVLPLRQLDLDQALEDLALAPRGLTQGLHTTVAAVDITAFGCRDNQTQLLLRKAMYGCLQDAFALLRLPWWQCYREDRGDGVLIITPPEISPEAFMDPLAHHLHARIRHRNRLASDSARLRLRMAVHTGKIHRDDNGVAGHPLIHLFRLLQASAFKRAAIDTDLSLIVSDQLYTDTTNNGGLIDPDAYRHRRILCKGTRTKAWIWLPPTSGPDN